MSRTKTTIVESGGQALSHFGIDYAGIPKSFRETMRGYLEDGHRPKGLVRLVLENDLFTALAWREVEVDTIVALCRFVFCFAPSQAYGSKEQVMLWMEQGGLKALEPARLERASNAKNSRRY